MKNWSEIFDGSNFSLLVCGSSGSGKTMLLKDLIQTMKKKYDYFVILCPSLEFSGDYKEFQDNDEKKQFTFFNEYDPRVLEEIMDTQADIIVRYGKNRCPKVVVILDDCMENIRQRSLVEKLYFKGRHLNISPISLVQKLKGISTILRVNTRYAVFFRAGNSSEVEHFLEAYTGKRERNRIEEILHEWFKEPYTFLFADFKTQKFEDRYMLGKNKKLIEQVEWNH
jgi:GTPase SAR1 family protein